MRTCENCKVWKAYAKVFDAHFDWRDCPYACEYAKEQVKEEEEKERKMIASMNESTRCAVEETKRETAKELLESMGVILEELNNEVRMISDAVYRGGCCNPVEEVHKEPENMPPMIVIMKEQRDKALEALNTLVKIREALW